MMSPSIKFYNSPVMISDNRLFLMDTSSQLVKQCSPNAMATKPSPSPHHRDNHYCRLDHHQSKFRHLKVSQSYREGFETFLSV